MTPTNPVSPEVARLLASALEAGRLAQRQGRTDNPFTGCEALRIAFHVGFSVEAETLRLTPEHTLVRMVAEDRLPAALK